MEYIVGSVAALVSGNITPSRPRGLKRAATPVKHPPSPNITPKSELVDDRSIFLSPTTQKKKAIIKKSPKRIFQNPELNVTEEKENLMTLKADKVKKHLKGELGGEGTSCMVNKVKSKSSNSQVQPDRTHEEVSPQTAEIADAAGLSATQQINQHTDSTEIKKKNKKSKKNRSEEALPQTAEITDDLSATQQDGKVNQHADCAENNKKSKKNKDKSGCLMNGGETDTVSDNMENQESKEITTMSLGKNRKNKKKRKQSKSNLHLNEEESAIVVNDLDSQDSERDHTNITNEDITGKESKKKKRKLKKSIDNGKISNESPLKKIKVNPNAITNKDTDSEHESDNEIESENDKEIDEVLEKDNSASEDEDLDQVQSNNLKPKKKIAKEVPSDTTEDETTVHDPEDVNRTLFVGNVPFSKKCKKEIKKIFSSYGDIETVRIRSVTVKDLRFTPKLAVIRNELHPERSVVNVYVKFKQSHSVQQALVENGRSLNEHTLRVSACSNAQTHDASRAVFVGNVPLACSDDELRAVFAASGAVASVRLVRDPNGLGKGFGYVNFECKDSVELALSLTAEQRTLRNRELRVKRCTLSQRDRSKLPKSSGGQAGVHPRGQYGARGQHGGRGQTGARGQFRGRGQTGPHRGGQHGGRGQTGAHPRGQYGGRGQYGARGRGGARTDAQRGDRQGAARRLDHKKKKSGEFVGLTPDSKTKPKVKTSRKKNALAEIMSK